MLKKTLLYIITFHLVFILIVHFSYAQYGTVKGKVSGKEGVLQSANISAGTKTLLTDKNGEYSFILEPGNYTIVVTHTGYKKINIEIRIEPANTQVQDFIMTPVEMLDEVVVTGSRSLTQRSNLSTPVPVDVITEHQLTQTGQASVTQMLNFAVPSFNSSRQLINEPITLRGLDPDQVLILVNGTRYHSMAFLNEGRIRGILGRGSVSNDLTSIPFSAIQKIEILRDGASAQYGSDAIAGVINVLLKKSTGKTSIQLYNGEFYKGDGDNINIGMNHGFSLPSRKNKSGFLNFSAEFLSRKPTHRGSEYNGTVYSTNLARDDSIVQARYFNRNSVSNAGTSRLSRFSGLINGGYAFNSKTELFWMATGNARTTFFTGAFRFPKNTRQINLELFPNGFKPIAKQKSNDLSAIAGIRGRTKNHWHWDVTTSFGKNTGDHYVDNTNNASQYYILGKDAPTRFYTGTQIFQQLTNSISFVKKILEDTTRIKSINIAFGSEWRIENYQTIAGEEAAWRNYDSSGRMQGGSQNGLVFSPGDVLDKKRNIAGTYFDLETELNERFMLALASRYEYYSDFGSNLAGKLSARYKFSDHFLLRGSINNGYRAPGLQQRYYNTSSKTVDNSRVPPVPVTIGIFNNKSIIARVLGVPSLQAERSLNVGGGLTATILNHISLTADAYWIRIKDRIVLSGEFVRGLSMYVDSVLKVYNLDVDRIRFFANAINTNTLGFDVIVNSHWKVFDSKLNVMLAANFTRTRLFGEIKIADSLKQELFTREEKAKLEKGQQASKIILSLNYKTGNFSFLVRNTRFGKTGIVYETTDPTRDEFYSSKILTDVNISYNLKKWLTITAGVNNLFDIYPDRIKNYINSGQGQFIYAMEASPFGFNGGFYYVNMSFSF